MVWLWVLVGVYAGIASVTWCVAYVELRPNRNRVKAWAAASWVALIWPVSVHQWRKWHRQHPAAPVDSPTNVADQAEAYLRQLR